MNATQDHIAAKLKAAEARAASPHEGERAIGEALAAYYRLLLSQVVTVETKRNARN